jgi:hypothetical protein
MISPLKTNDLKKCDIPLKYNWESFVVFSLTFDPILEMNNWKDSDYISPSKTPTLEDSLIGIRAYLYHLQRVNNQYIKDENILKKRVEYAYSILRKKLE